MTPDTAAPNWDEYPIELPVRGFAVLRIEFGVPFYIWAYGNGKKHLKLMLSGKFVLAEPDGAKIQLDPDTDPWERLTPTLVLRDEKITSATISSASDLDIAFDSGRSIASKPYDAYEPWELLAPGCFIVGQTGEPAVWTGSAWDQAD